MKRVWALIYLGYVILCGVAGVVNLLPSRTERTNADWILVGIIFAASTVYPVAYVAVCRFRGGAAFRRPTIDRGPFGGFGDPLQLLRVATVGAVGFAVGAAIAVPIATAKGVMIFFVYVGISCGLMIGEVVTYKFFRERIE